MYVLVTDGRVAEVRLDIYKPPRFFEAFLRGRSYTEPPTSPRRCAASAPSPTRQAPARQSQMRAARVDGAIADLRRLLYCGDWIGNHALQIYMLHAPDFLGYQASSRWRLSTGRSWSTASPCEVPGTRSWNGATAGNRTVGATPPGRRRG
jgi:coenzyme F420-reducing hydrogenase alpha subunit